MATALLTLRTNFLTIQQGSNVRSLTESEAALWKRVTNTVTPLGERPVSINGGPVGVASLVARPTCFNPVLDLHGLTVHDAYARAFAHVSEARLDKRFRYVIIITGLSGQIHEEFPRWFENHSAVRSVKALRGGGAWEVWLKKDTSTRTS